MQSVLSRVAATRVVAMVALVAQLGATAALAADPPAAAAEGGKRYATVLRLKGEVAALAGAGAPERKLRVGDAVYVGESIRSSAQAEAVLKTEDAGMVAVRPRTEFVADRFSAEDKPTDGLALRLLAGSLRIISGWVAHTNRAGNTVQTPTATVGIRGTDHEPFVLTAELATSLGAKEGTYDKVNRGGTTLQVEENSVDIEPGKVGFVRAAKKNGVKERGLLTLLLPVLLDRVPGFYVPGQFDEELDRYSQGADQEGLRQLEARRRAGGAAASGATAAATTPAAPVGPDCLASATAVARDWLTRFDGGITKRNAKAVVALFAPDAVIQATVRTGDGGSSTIDLDREEMAQSSINALKSLKNYQQRRLSLEARPANAAGAATCSRVSLRSLVVEQGEQGGKPYRFEALEEYLLELREGKWLATRASTVQQ